MEPAIPQKEPTVKRRKKPEQVELAQISALVADSVGKLSSAVRGFGSLGRRQATTLRSILKLLEATLTAISRLIEILADEPDEPAPDVPDRPEMQ
jgi:hypothetical protein